MLINVCLLPCIKFSFNVSWGFKGYPQPGGGTHPPIPSEGVLREVLGDGGESTVGQGLKSTRFRVVRAAGA